MIKYHLLCFQKNNEIMKRITIFILLISLFCSTLNASTFDQNVIIPSTNVHAIDGMDWATNISVSILTGNIYWAYIDENLRGIVVQKRPNGETISTVVMTDIANDDNHSEISLAIDNNGHIHVAAGNHNSYPRYYVSKNPNLSPHTELLYQ